LNELIETPFSPRITRIDAKENALTTDNGPRQKFF